MQSLKVAAAIGLELLDDGTIWAQAMAATTQFWDESGGDDRLGSEHRFRLGPVTAETTGGRALS